MLLLILMPAYWPWFVLLPLALALCSTDHNTRLLALLLMVGAIVDYYCWQWPQVWTGQALVAVWLPLLLWGWMMFFSSLWHVSHNARKARQ
ncbi:MAG: hypothetical protein IMW89_09600 [Ktedonobacteraceae bacterium]|nr:hypothetical protein [Ktedonobacteraceae bacterium]